MRSKVNVHRRRKNRPGNALSLTVRCDPACTGQYGEELPQCAGGDKRSSGRCLETTPHLPVLLLGSLDLQTPFESVLPALIPHKHSWLVLFFFFAKHASVSTFFEAPHNLSASQQERNKCSHFESFPLSSLKAPENKTLKEISGFHTDFIFINITSMGLAPSHRLHQGFN